MKTNKRGVVGDFFLRLKTKLLKCWSTTQTKKMPEGENSLRKMRSAEAEGHLALAEIHERQSKVAMLAQKVERELQSKEANFDKLVKGSQYEIAIMNECKEDSCNEASNKAIIESSLIEDAAEVESTTEVIMEDDTEVESTTEDDSDNYQDNDGDDYLIIDDDFYEAEEGWDYEYVGHEG
jgi:rubrerythrin